MMRMIVLDIDGTSISDDYKISRNLVELIKRLKEKHIICIATGRSLSDAYEYYKCLELKNNIICHNGALIYNPTKNKIKYKKSIQKSNEMLKFFNEVKNKFEINNIILSKINETYLLNHENDFLLDIIINKELPYYFIGEKIINIHDSQRIIISVNPSYRSRLTNILLKQYPNTIICGWKGRNDIIDISVGNINKWKAIQVLAKDNNIKYSNIISFGDSMTDVELLKNSGLGICMANGIDEAKRIADDITQYDNNNDGVFNYIVENLKYLLTDVRIK